MICYSCHSPNGKTHSTQILEHTTAESKQLPIGAIVGGTVGGVALIALLILGFFWYRRKNKNQVAPYSEKIPIVSQGNAPGGTSPAVTPSGVPTPWTPPTAAGTQYDYIGTEFVPPSSSPPPWTIPATLPSQGTEHVPPSSSPAPWTVPTAPSTQADQPLLTTAAAVDRSPTYMTSSGSSIRPMSTTSMSLSRHGSPPVYGSSVYAYVGSSGPLASWANANRAFVTEDLESKLSNAGYVPTDDPDDLTEEEWTTKYGLTKLEIVRLRKLYAG